MHCCVPSSATVVVRPAEAIPGMAIDISVSERLVEFCDPLQDFFKARGHSQAAASVVGF
jgi:hypothetical protein